MDISEVCKQTGVPSSALRYYEKLGLIHSVTEKGKRRRYAPSVLDQLALIALGQTAGLSLEEIRSMLTPYELVQSLSRAPLSGAKSSA